MSRRTGLIIILIAETKIKYTTTVSVWPAENLYCQCIMRSGSDGIFAASAASHAREPSRGPSLRLSRNSCPRDLMKFVLGTKRPNGNKRRDDRPDTVSYHRVRCWRKYKKDAHSLFFVNKQRCRYFTLANVEERSLGNIISSNS